MKNSTSIGLLTESEAAELLAVSVHWLRKRRSLGGGPPFIKFCGLVRYQREAIDRYAQGNVFIVKGVPAKALSKEAESGRN